MKRMKRVLALALAMIMVMAMGIGASATQTYGAENDHTITITNADQNVSHTYEGYQIFAGNLDSKELTLSDIQWGEGVNGTTLLAALKASTDDALKAVAADLTEGKDALGKDLTVGANIFTNCETAQDVAKILATFTSTGQKYDADGKPTSDDGTTDDAGRIDAVATIIGDTEGVLKSDKKISFTEDDKEYTAEVTGDGYYFIKDVTTKAGLNNEDDKTSDTRSKYLLSVVKDVTIVAKDTGLEPDKKILGENNTQLAADSAAIGDEVTFQVTVEVPNTKKYEEHFWFIMNDTLPEGITFTGITSVTVGSKTLYDTSKVNPEAPISDDEYTDTAAAKGYYTLVVTNADDSADDYDWEASDYDAVKAPGGQTIELTFNQFKKFVEVNDLIGEQVVVTYTGVVNDDAEYEATENENEVTFDFSNDPNHDYDGDNPGPEDDDVTGTTPESKTRTYTTSIKILKVDENNEALEGAEFTLTGENLNRTVLTGTKFVASNYELPENGEAFEKDGSENKKYWKLKDGSYTATDPATVQNKTQYDDPNTFYYKVIYDFVELAPNETTSPLVVVTDTNGEAEFVGMNAGEYTLEETHAPEGYNKIDGTSTITITWYDPEGEQPDGVSDDDWAAAQAQGGFILAEADESDDTVFGIEWDANAKQFEVTIQNKSGSVLPSTGGIGTTMFYVVGAILVIGAGVLLVSRKRMNLR